MASATGPASAGPTAADDRTHMLTAISLAKSCIPVTTAYNVGAVLLAPSSPPTVLSTGFSRELPGNTHAEECALLKISKNDTLHLARGATIYTTMEPCGERLSGKRTCAERLIEAGVSRVVVGVREPSHFIAECQGTVMLRAAGIDVDYFSGLEEQCQALNEHI
ncbi:putative diaminohydroxyphosphoribosylamino-pyrimidine deaminase [Geranomyces variabilis]|nr:putative diaminohydroxyphosphoribosylamino-pyrimidine deaminase [Geranomyces variabilis]KAJ3142272.1 DRAP deaminase [Geranomyces variabilis]